MVMVMLLFPVKLVSFLYFHKAIRFYFTNDATFFILSLFLFTGIFYFKNIGTKEKAIIVENPSCTTYASSLGRDAVTNERLGGTYTSGCNDKSYSPFYINGAIMEVRGWGIVPYWESHYSTVYMAIVE